MNLMRHQGINDLDQGVDLDQDRLHLVNIVMIDATIVIARTSGTGLLLATTITTITITTIALISSNPSPILPTDRLTLIVDLLRPPHPFPAPMKNPLDKRASQPCNPPPHLLQPLVTHA
jgi:hypothetical protein